MSTTYSNIRDDHSVKAVCTTGTESAPTTSATDGLDLARGSDGSGHPVGWYEVRVFPTGAGTALTVGTLDAYVYDTVYAKWMRLYNADGTGVSLVVVTGLGNDVGVAFVAQEAHGMERVTYVPTGLGVACTIEILGTPRRVV